MNGRSQSWKKIQANATVMGVTIKRAFKSAGQVGGLKRQLCMITKLCVR